MSGFLFLFLSLSFAQEVKFECSYDDHGDVVVDIHFEEALEIEGFYIQHFRNYPSRTPLCYDFSGVDPDLTQQFETSTQTRRYYREDDLGNCHSIEEELATVVVPVRKERYGHASLVGSASVSKTSKRVRRNYCEDDHDDR